LRVCLNKRVAVGLLVAAAGVYAMAPSIFAAAWPLFVVALCPLSMLLMVWAMRTQAPASCEHAHEDRAAAARPGAAAGAPLPVPIRPTARRQ